MKGYSALLVTAFALVFMVSMTACTADSLTGPEQIEQTNSVQTLDARHNIDPAASNNGGGSVDKHGSHNRVDEEE